MDIEDPNKATARCVVRVEDSPAFFGRAMAHSSPAGHSSSTFLKTKLGCSRNYIQSPAANRFGQHEGLS
jgi:hypothetical protein